MNIVIAVEPDQVDLALRSIAHIQQTGLDEGSRLHVICEPESADALRPVDGSHQLHVCEDADLRARFAFIKNFQFAYACMVTAGLPGPMLYLPPGIAPIDAQVIEGLQGEYNNSGKIMGHASATEQFPQPKDFAVYPEDYWNRSTVVKYLWGSRVPHWTEKLSYEVGHDSYRSDILGTGFIFVPEQDLTTSASASPELDEAVTAPVERPAAAPKVVKAKKKHVRMKRRTPAVA